MKPDRCFRGNPGDFVIFSQDYREGFAEIILLVSFVCFLPSNVGRVVSISILDLKSTETLSLCLVYIFMLSFRRNLPSTFNVGTYFILPTLNQVLFTNNDQTRDTSRTKIMTRLDTSRTKIEFTKVHIIYNKQSRFSLMLCRFLSN